jgi:hypothetical protein
MFANSRLANAPSINKLLFVPIPYSCSQLKHKREGQISIHIQLSGQGLHFSVRTVTEAGLWSQYTKAPTPTNS